MGKKRSNFDIRVHGTKRGRIFMCGVAAKRKKERKNAASRYTTQDLVGLSLREPEKINVSLLDYFVVRK